MNEDRIFIAEVSKLIEEKEDYTIDWIYVLNSFGFDQLNEEYPEIVYGSDMDYKAYHWSLIRIIRDAYGLNKENFRLMIEYIIKVHLKIDDDDLRVYPWLKSMLNGANDDLKPEYVKKDYLKAFISYSNDGKLVGVKIKEMLENFGIECFMAHDDIDASEEWKERILEELNEADVFIPILSDNFRSSEWCSQEAGIACFRNVLIIPLSIDGAKPYGFMGHRQGKLINRHDIPLSYLLNPISDNFPEFDIFGGLIDELEFVKGFRTAESIMRNLEPYFNKLSINEINRVVDVSIANNQIWDAGGCRREYLPKFIRINKDKIDRNKLERLLGLIEYNLE